MAQGQGGYIVGKIIKELSGSNQKVSTGCIGEYILNEINMSPLFTLWLYCNLHYEWNQHVSGGSCVIELLKKSQWNHNVSFRKILHNKDKPQDIPSIFDFKTHFSLP